MPSLYLLKSCIYLACTLLVVFFPRNYISSIWEILNSSTINALTATIEHVQDRQIPSEGKKEQARYCIILRRHAGVINSFWIPLKAHYVPLVIGQLSIFSPVSQVVKLLFFHTLGKCAKVLQFTNSGVSLRSWTCVKCERKGFCEIISSL